MSDRRFLFFYNPISGGKTKDAMLSFLKNYCESNELEFWMQKMRKTPKYDDVIENVKENQITDIVIIGGDGSINNVVGAFHHLDEIQFGVIPFGSGNGLARSAKIPMNPRKAWLQIVQKDGKFIDAFLLNQQFSCMLDGIGFDAQIAYDFAQSGKRGLKTYVLKTIQNFFSSRPYPFTIKTDEFEFSTEAFFISIGNSNQFGNNFTIAPKASLEDGLLDFVILQKVNKLQFIISMMKQVTNLNKLIDVRHIRKHRAILYFQSDKITIQNPNLAPIHIDGDPIDSHSSIQIEVLPQCFKLIH